MAALALVSVTSLSRAYQVVKEFSQSPPLPLLDLADEGTQTISYYENDHHS